MTTENSDDNIIPFEVPSEPQTISDRAGLDHLRMRVERIVAVMVNFSDIIDGIEEGSIDYTAEDLVVVDLVLQRLEQGLMTGTIYDPDE